MAERNMSELDETSSPPSKDNSAFYTPVQEADRNDPGKYRYNTLPGDEFIRVFLLDPATDISRPLSGSFMYLDLTKDEKYSALSYSWATEDGDISFCRSITINESGQVSLLNITANLHDGLRRIRKADDIVRLWVDAICINQDNTRERNHQVARMAKIYRQAERVIIWLGEGENAEADERAWNILHRVSICSTGFADWEDVLCALLHTSPDFWCDWQASTPGRRCTRDRYAKGGADCNILQTIPEANEEREYARLALAFQAIFAKRYWTRRWVAQEFVHACAQDWYWGSCSLHAIELPSAVLVQVKRFWYTNGWIALFEKAGPGLAVACTLSQLREGDGSIQGLHGLKAELADTRKLLEVLQDAKSMECEDPRDLLYSILGLCDHPPLTPDYDLSVDEVYIAFAGHLVRSQMGDFVFGALSCQIRSYWCLRKEGLPSWVPDLRQDFQLYVMNRRFEGTISENGRNLRCDAYKLGVLSDEIIDVANKSATVVFPNGLPGYAEPLDLKVIGDFVAGDIVAASSKVLAGSDWSHEYAAIIALRLVDAALCTYRLVGTATGGPRPVGEVFSMSSAGGDGDHLELDIEAEDGSDIVVNII